MRNAAGVIMLLACAAAAARGQTSGPATSTAPAGQSATAASQSGRHVYELTVSPQATTQPALGNPLLPPVEETKDGNAVLFYLTATTELPEELKKIDFSDDLNSPLATLDKTKYASLLGGDWRQTLRLGAYREQAQWPHDGSSQGVPADLAALGSIRSLAMLLALHTRVALKDKQTDEVLEDLRIGYKLGRDLTKGRTLIEALVGTGITRLMNEQLMSALEQPKTPNLYWDLVALPHPLIDGRRALRYERSMLQMSSPEVRTADEGRYYKGQWQSIFKSLNPNAYTSALKMAFGAAVAYPEADRYLQAHGFSADQVKAMSIDEALMRFTLMSYRTTADDMYKILNLPAYQAIPRAFAFDKRLRKPSSPFDLARITLPSLSRVIVIFTQLDEQFAMLQIVEALRDHAAHHDGVLPATLDQMALPAPVDPMTNQPFGYQVSGSTATITGGRPEGVALRDQQIMIVHMRAAKK